MSRTIQVISLVASSTVWLAIVIPGTVGDHGIYWESLLILGTLPVAAIWAVFLFSLLSKRKK